MKNNINTLNIEKYIHSVQNCSCQKINVEGNYTLCNIITKSKLFVFAQGHDEEAVVDMGKISSTINTNFEKEELESKYTY